MSKPNSVWDWMLIFSCGSASLGAYSSSEISAQSLELNCTQFVSSPVGGLISSTEETGVGGVTAGTTIVPSVSTTLDSADGGEQALVIFRNDCMPYTKIEKRANRIYNALHNEKKMGKFGIIIANTKETGALLQTIFKKQEKEEILETLDILESILKNE